jgi:hypothetical protein
MNALDQVLTAQGASLSRLVADFGYDNRSPASFYEEGSSYPTAKVAKAWTLTKSKRGIGWQTYRPYHVANLPFAFKPGRGFGGAWKLAVRVDLPGLVQEPYAQVRVVPLSGPPRRFFVKLNADGVGRTAAAFNRNTIRRVEVTLTNGGHDYRCDDGTDWSCQGTPTDSGRVYKFRVFGYR